MTYSTLLASATLALLVATSSSVIGCTFDDIKPKSEIRACDLLTKADAERILGQTIERIDEDAWTAGDVPQSRCNYSIAGTGPMDGKQINFYFSIERRVPSASVSSAQDYYEATRLANSGDAVLEELTKTGDRAYLQNVPPNLMFILIQKGDWIVRIKINKCPPTVSLANLKAWARTVADRL